jgi:hypothetical protein
MFVENISGTLMKIRPSQHTRYEYDIWFPYTREAINTVHNGTMIAVRNFSSTNEKENYSILRITSVLPHHYALAAGLDGYPGFVVEAAINAAKDWEQESPTEDTTKILCTAVPSFLEIQKTPAISANPSEPELATETNMPMPGEKVSILNKEWTEHVINQRLQDPREKTIDIGNLPNYEEEIAVKMLWENLIQTHFGIFAYTNAGKSNLLSTCAAKIMDNSDSVKIVMYDLMGEYGALLIDILCRFENSCIICTKPETMPQSVFQFWQVQNPENLQRAAMDIVNTTILPKALHGDRLRLVEPVKQLLRDGKIKIQLQTNTLGYSLSRRKEQILHKIQGTAAPTFVAFVQNLIDGNMEIPVSSDLISRTRAQVVAWAPAAGNMTGTMTNSRNKLLDVLDGLANELELISRINSRFRISLQDMISELNNAETKSLYIIQGSNDEDVRIMSQDLGSSMLENRRQTGTIFPLVSFVYDEADLFIPQIDKADQPGMEQSRNVAEQIARRGRKYGLGIGIATQRIVYLDTNVLGQPHTYFVSKLPRQTDRDRIQEAFGLSDETLNETFRFGVGEWLLISHNATGIDGLPIPVKLPDANKRISDFLNSFRPTA